MDPGRKFRRFRQGLGLRFRMGPATRNVCVARGSGRLPEADGAPGIIVPAALDSVY